MGVLDEGFASLAEDMEAHNSEPVTYTVGETGAVIVIAGATRQRTTHERFALADGRVSFEEVPQDWSIRPSAIDLGGILHEPTRGDRIEDAAGRVYQVTPRSDEPAVRLVDNGQSWRIRTVLVQEP